MTQAQLSPERISRIFWGAAMSLTLEAALHLNVFDQLDAGPRTADEVAKATKCAPRGMRALLGALVGMELLTREGDRFALTPESAAFLVHSKPTFFGALAERMREQYIPAWLPLEDAVRTGEPRRRVDTEGEASEFFPALVAALFRMNFPAARALSEALKVGDGNAAASVLDLAAGSCVWSLPIAQRSKHVRVTAIDWPGVLATARRHAEQHGVAAQYAFVGGDLATVDLGKGHDVALLGHILHSLGEAKSRDLLKRAAAALRPGGTIAIAEFVPNDERTGPLVPMLFGLNMLMNTEDGDVFTLAQMRGWLEDAGFRDVRTLAAPAPSPLILATRK